MWVLVVPAMMLLPVSCTGNKGETTVADVDGEKVSFLPKSGESMYECVNDTLFGTDVPLYSAVSASVMWPVSVQGGNVKSLQDSLLSRCFGKNAVGQSLDVALQNYLADAPHADVSELRPVDSIPSVGMPRVLSREVEASVLSLNENVLVYKIYNYMYEGGAHPLYFTSFVNYDIKGGRVLGVGDLFETGTDAEVIAAIKANLYERYRAANDAELAEYSGINVEDLYVTSTFYIADGYVVFHYNPYEVGPWVIGAIEVPVPAFQLEPVLTNVARDLFGF